MLVVKADAYGHGAVTIARHAVRCGVGALGVGTSAEALELRQAGLDLPILVLGTIVDAELRPCLEHGIHIGLHTTDRCQNLANLAASLGILARVHLNVDTGMGRLGVPPSLALDLLREVAASEHLEIAGIMTHISSPDGGLDPDTRDQVRAFQELIRDANVAGLARGWIHVANSACLFTDAAFGDTVRPGIAAYGALPPHLPGSSDLRAVMNLRSQIVMLKDIQAGTPVGYGSTWRAAHNTRIATLAIGYADGVPWALSNKGEVLIRGQRAPIVGRVSMDYVTVDVGAIDGVHVGDVATLFGTSMGSELPISEVARVAGTIPYELTCAVGPRVDRVPIGGNALALPAQPADAAPPLPPPGNARGTQDSAPDDLSRKQGGQVPTR
jgi:alanine racemase